MPNQKNTVIIAGIAAVIIVILASIVIVMTNKMNNKSDKTKDVSVSGSVAVVDNNASTSESASSGNPTDATVQEEIEDIQEDPQYSGADNSMNQDSGTGAKVTLSNSTNETSDVTIGVDV